jgi:hypothetical protein
VEPLARRAHPGNSDLRLPEVTKGDRMPSPDLSQTLVRELLDLAVERPCLSTLGEATAP